MKDSRQIIIVGAGVAGLSLAKKLCDGGSDQVLLVEKEAAVGGLARSFSEDGFTFDVGPHRFHTDDGEVLEFIREVLGGDYLTIDRKSGVWMFDRYFPWPLDFSALFKMPRGVLWSVALDLFRKGGGGKSFEEYIISRYGRTLYDIFFRPYTEKFLRVECSGISRDWAITGIDRAVIDGKVQMNDLWSLAKTVLFPEPPLEFIYPASGGISVFCEKLQAEIVGKGCRVLLDSRVQEIVTQDNRVSKVIIDGEEHGCDLLVWTAPVTEAGRLLGHEAELDFLDLILYNYRVDYRIPMDYQWCYFGSAGVPFNRVSIPSRFNPALAPEGKTGLCVEVSCYRGDRAWQDPERAEPAIRRSLAAAGVLRSADERVPFSIERVPNAYPVYAIDYLENSRALAEKLQAVENLRLLGRSGGFWYNNMDHSISETLKLYREISGEDAAAADALRFSPDQEGGAPHLPGYRLVDGHS